MSHPVKVYGFPSSSCAHALTPLRSLWQSRHADHQSHSLVASFNPQRGVTIPEPISASFQCIVKVWKV